MDIAAVQTGNVVRRPGQTSKATKLSATSDGEGSAEEGRVLVTGARGGHDVALA